MDARDRLGERHPQALPASRARRHCIAMEDQPPFLSGKLLLAMPGMADPRFERAVIALCVHDENGAIGIGIGHKRAGIGFRGLLRQLDIDPGEAPDARSITADRSSRGAASSSIRTDWGGQDTLHVAGPNGTLFAMTGTIDILRAIAEGRGPDAVDRRAGLCRLGRRPARGGNDPPRLVRGAPATAPILFDTPADERWAAAFKAEGIDPRLLVSEAGVA